MESHPSKLVGSRGSKSRYFDFDKLAEVCIFKITSLIACALLSFYLHLLLC